MIAQVIHSGQKTLKALGYRVHGTPEDWAQVLSGYSAEQLRAAFKSVSESHSFGDVRPATLTGHIREQSYHGSGKSDLPLDQWHTWKEECQIGRNKDGSPKAEWYEFAWHPSMSHACGCPRCKNGR